MNRGGARERKISTDLALAERSSENEGEKSSMAIASNLATFQKSSQVMKVICRKKERGRDQHQPYKVIEITPPPKNLGVRCFPSNMHCGESVTIEDRAYTISAVTHRYKLRKGKYEPCEQRLDVLSTGRYILNLYLENLLEQS
uniref:Uncharacterized protein n=1 Tax=Kalanchoe fedtschenkoi TaxID=63787 RepID=A0A7N0U8I9_KALFE